MKCSEGGNGWNETMVNAANFVDSYIVYLGGMKMNE